MYFIYILKNDKSSLYVGSTSNIENRITRHNTGMGAEFTKRNMNFKLVYFERFGTLLEARHRENQIKGWRREKKENLIKYGKPMNE